MHSFDHPSYVNPWILIISCNESNLCNVKCPTDSFSMINSLIFLYTTYKSLLLQFSCSTLDASMSHQSPAVPLAGAERTLLGFLVNLHLKSLHVCLIFLIGCKAHSWERRNKHMLSLLLCFKLENVRCF